jgi:hypothetical protein
MAESNCHSPVNSQQINLEFKLYIHVCSILVLDPRDVEDQRPGYHALGHDFGTLIGPQHIEFGSQLAKY